MIMPKNYTLQNASNLGWLFYKDYYRQEPNVDFISTQGKESDTTADFFRKTNQRITAYQLNSESPLVAAFNNHFGTPLQLKTIYPGLITGSGLPHQTGSKGEFKLGFQFDYTTGLPYIPGSSIKGTLRSMFPFSLKDKGSTKRILPEYRKERMEYLKNKKERDWKFIIGMIVLLAIFAVMGGAFWNMVGKQAQMVREEEQKEEANAISAIYIETGEFLKTGVFVDLNNGTIFSADIPAEGIYNKKGKLISDDVLENGDKVKIYGDGIMLESFPGQYPGVTKIQRTGRASLEETQEYEDQVTGMMKPVAVQ